MLGRLLLLVLARGSSGLLGRDVLKRDDGPWLLVLKRDGGFGLLVLDVLWRDGLPDVLPYDMLPPAKRIFAVSAPLRSCDSSRGAFSVKLRAKNARPMAAPSPSRLSRRSTSSSVDWEPAPKSRANAFAASPARSFHARFKTASLAFPRRARSNSAPPALPSALWRRFNLRSVEAGLVDSVPDPTSWNCETRFVAFFTTGACVEKASARAVATSASSALSCKFRDCSEVFERVTRTSFPAPATPMELRPTSKPCRAIFWCSASPRHRAPSSLI
mmetsp:Transcript_539/g.865  ORF Transcript_539/g.865 Transcript_539/m.865 type:complete len:273 (+) Transcript_539:202-1020(+)